MTGGTPRAKSKSRMRDAERSPYMSLESRCVSPPRGRGSDRTGSHAARLASRSPPRVEKLPPPSSPRYASPLMKRESTRRHHPVHTASTPSPIASIPAPATHSPGLEQRFNALQSSMQTSLQTLESQVQSIAQMVDQRPQQHPSSDCISLAALREELQRDPSAMQLTGPYSSTCRAIKSVLQRNVAMQLADWADMWEERGASTLRSSITEVKNEFRNDLSATRIQDQVQGLQQQVSQMHRTIADSERKIDTRMQGLEETMQEIGSRLSTLEAASKKASKYNDDVWRHLQDVSRTMEKGLADHSADVAMELETLKVTVTDTGVKLQDVQRTVMSHDTLLKGRDVRELSSRLQAVEEAYCSGEDLSRLRDDVKKGDEELNTELGNLEARLLRQLGQDGGKKRMIEDRLAKLELEARDDTGLRHVVDSLRQELSEGETSYRRRLDAQDKQIRDLKKAGDESTSTVREIGDACNCLRRQVQDLHDAQGSAPTSGSRTDVIEVRSSPVREQSGVSRQMRDDVERLKKQVSSNTSSLQVVITSVDDLQDQLSAESVRIDGKADSLTLTRLVADSLQKAVDTVKRTLITPLERRVAELEEGTDMDNINNMIIEMEGKIHALQADRKAKRDTVDRRMLDKYDEMIQSLQDELYDMRDAMAVDTTAADAAKAVRRVQEELQKLQRELRQHAAQAKATADEVPRLQEEMQELHEKLSAVRGELSQQVREAKMELHSEVEQVSLTAQGQFEDIRRISEKTDTQQGMLEGMSEDKVARFKEHRGLIQELEMELDKVRRQLREALNVKE